jgi:hypothetical protein
MAAAARRLISDDLLELSIRIKRDAGVGHAQIQTVIDQFACTEQWTERSGGIGFPLAEDIPQDRRADFMAALAELSPSPDRKPDAGSARYLSISDVWPDRIVD